MSPFDWPREVVFYGDDCAPPAVTELRAGDLKLFYEAGALRDIRWRDVEIVRMIYAAVRDANWLTIGGRILNERIAARPNCFEISYDCLYQAGEIEFEASYHLSGDENGQIGFSMRGEAKRAFAANRIGFCVLHPITECAGKRCEILSPDGERRETAFPRLIEPHQPFKNVGAMHWQPATGCAARLELEGDVFETEDQRNWTDASFKTYCTPLERPFPMAVQPRQRFEQSVTLRVAIASQRTAVRPEPEASVRFTLVDAPPRALPPVGLGCSTQVRGRELSQVYSAPDVAAVRALRLAHLRGEVRLYQPDWKTQLAAAGAEAALFDVPLQLAVFCGGEAQAEVEALLETLRQEQIPISALLLLHRDFKVTPDLLFDELAPRLRAALPRVALGVGTDAFFTELNRQRPQAECDFLSFSVNPQVHAADNRSLVENLVAQAEVVHSARVLAGKRALHVAPVTLKRRNNPDATGVAPPEPSDELPWDVDARQMSLLGAAWTLGSLKYLAQAGADSLTFYQVAGLRGVLQGRIAPRHETQFYSAIGARFPTYFVLREALGAGAAQIVPWQSSAPLRADGLLLRFAAGRQKAIIANYTPQTHSVRFAAPTSSATLRIFDETAARRQFLRGEVALEEQTLGANPDGDFSFSLPPFAVAVVEMQGVSL